MSSFRFIITDINNGSVVGLNDQEKARSLAESEDYFVFDSWNGVWLTPGNKSVEVKSIDPFGFVAEPKSLWTGLYRINSLATARREIKFSPEHAYPYGVDGKKE